MPVSEELAEAAKVSDTAVVVIGRAAGEDRELTYEEIKLTDDEKTMLFNVNKYFENIIVLMNVGNVIDMSWRTDYDNIKSVVYVWQVLNSVHPEYIDVSGGTLNITTDIGEWHQNANSLRNIIYQTMEGDFEATVDVTVPAGLNGCGANQFGMVVFDDSNNYADIRYQTTAKGRYYNLSNHYIAFVNETNAVATIALRDPVIMNEGWNTDAYTGELKVTFKVAKIGDTYTFGYKTAKMAIEDKDFVTVGTYEGKFAEPKIGLFATRVASSSPSRLLNLIISISL